MAKAPKSSTRKTTTRSKSAKATSDKVEDAVVIEETTPEPTDPPEEPDKVEESAETTDAEEEKGPSPSEEEEAHADADVTDDLPGEDEKEPGPEAAPPVAPAIAVEPTNRRGGTGAFLGMLLGGVAAAAIGFVAARYIVPEGWPFPGVPPEEDPVALAVQDQGNQLAAFGERIGTLEASVSENSAGLDALGGDIASRLDGLGGDLAAMSTRLDEMETRLAAVEKLAPEGSAAAQMAAEAYDRELNALREMFQGELDQIEAAQTDAAALQAQAADAAQAAAGREAMAKVMAALDSGQPFEAALADLTNSTGVDVPAELTNAADEGVPTLAGLQEAFPPAARAALDASVRAAVDSGEVSRFSAFLQTQLGTRSLEPKEGGDADAVLSRAEAALKQGDLATALSELEALPEAGQPAMAEWRALAEERKAALDAGNTLAQELNSK